MNNDFLTPPEDVSNLKWKFVLFKRFFDTGYGITNYFKYIIALFGISSLNIKATLALGILYGFFCFFVGWAWFRYKFMEVDTEVGNRTNRFVGEMREKIK